MLARDLARNLARPLVRNLTDPPGGSPLVFHALDDVGGVFSADVIKGAGSITEGRTATIYLPDDSGIWQTYGSGDVGRVYAGGEWWAYVGSPLTNSQIRSFDLTNVEWTAANMTVALDETGMRNDANGASSLTATTGNATVLANAITDAADDQATRWFLKRKTGSGTIEITVNGGTTWQDVTTEVDSTSGFNEAIESLAALANPQIGIRIVTSGDAVIVGNAECFLGNTEADIRRSSAIFTAAGAVTVSASRVKFASANHDQNQGAYFFEIMPMMASSEQLQGDSGLLHLRAATNFGNGIINTRSASVQDWYGSNDSAFSRSRINQATTAAVKIKLAVAYDATAAKQKLNLDGTYGPEVAYSGTFLDAGGDGLRLSFNFEQGGVCLFRNLRRYDLDYVAGQAKIDELMA